MRTIHADWEIRNLGVDCMEFHLDKNDTVEQIYKAEDDLKNFRG